MSFEFTEGPTSTQMTLDQIVDAIDTMGRERRFVGAVNRLNSKRLKQYGAFAPQREYDPSHAAPARQPDRRIGWQRKYFTPTPAGAREYGWDVVFELFDDGPARRVLIKVQGESDRKEVDRFLKLVLEKLWWEPAASTLNA